IQERMAKRSHSRNQGRSEVRSLAQIPVTVRGKRPAQVISAAKRTKEREASLQRSRTRPPLRAEQKDVLRSTVTTAISLLNGDPRRDLLCQPLPFQRQPRPFRCQARQTSRVLSA